MKIQFVGAKPVISHRGVGFDESSPDKYQFLQSAIELLEALSYGATATTEHLYTIEDKHCSAEDLLDRLKAVVGNVEPLQATRQEAFEAYLAQQKERIAQNEHLSADEKLAYENNLEVMHAYILQYIANEVCYNAALEHLVKEVFDAKILSVSFPMFRNYGVVMQDLTSLLNDHKPPVDAEVDVSVTDKGLVGTLTVHFC